ncbi:MAG: tetratricopeptide repeat protein [Flavobacteriales bacterium]|nr:tetratricopeptide repeat protein [Flavobacteriales bacterium]
MRFSTKSQIFAVAFSIALVVLLYLLPSKVADTVVAENNTPVNIEDAIELVKSGSDPMKGILKLREISEEDPKNVKAQFYLGIFSVQSGQLEKAVTRLTKVLELDPNYMEAYLYLGHSYSGLGNKELAIESFEKFRTSIEDLKLIEEVEKHIKELKNN